MANERTFGGGLLGPALLGIGAGLLSQGFTRVPQTGFEGLGRGLALAQKFQQQALQQQALQQQLQERKAQNIRDTALAQANLGVRQNALGVSRGTLALAQQKRLDALNLLKRQAADRATLLNGGFFDGGSGAAAAQDADQLPDVLPTAKTGGVPGLDLGTFSDAPDQPFRLTPTDRASLSFLSGKDFGKGLQTLAKTKFSQAAKLQTAYEKAAQPLINQRKAARVGLEAAPTRAGDVSMLFSFVRSVDDNAVREGEVRFVTGALLPPVVNDAIAGLQGGRERLLRTDQRAAIRAQLRQQGLLVEKVLQETNQQFSARAQQFGINPNQVVRPLRGRSLGAIPSKPELSKDRSKVVDDAVTRALNNSFGGS